MLIDFRARPPTPEMAHYFTEDRLRWSYTRYVGTDELPRSIQERSLDLFVPEMDAAGRL